MSLDEVFTSCLRLGELMLQDGAETYRVEETMERVARACGVQDIASFVTPTGIFLSLEGRTQIRRVVHRTVNLDRVARGNRLSRGLESGEIQLEEMPRLLDELESRSFPYAVPWVHIAAGAASGFFALLFGGTFADFVPVFLAGVAVNLSFFLFTRYFGIKFIAEFLSCLVGGLSVVGFVNLGLGEHLHAMFIGMLIPLFPGVAITNAVRDLMAGDLVAGVARGAEAALTAFALAVGVAVVLGLFIPSPLDTAGGWKGSHVGLGLVWSLLTSFFYGILYGVPINALAGGAIIGMLGWGLYTVEGFQGWPPMAATFASAWAVGLLSHFFARVQREPASVFNVIGIIPLVPGAMAFGAILQFIQEQEQRGLVQAVETALTAGAIGGGLVFSLMLVQLMKGPRKHA